MVIIYSRPYDKPSSEIARLGFSDTSNRVANEQLGVLLGLLVCNLARGSIFHCASWLSNNSERPVNSVPTAIVLAACEAVVESKSMSHAQSELLNLHNGTRLYSDPKKRFLSIFTQHNSIDQSVCANVACIQYNLKLVMSIKLYGYRVISAPEALCQKKMVD